MIVLYVLGYFYQNKQNSYAALTTRCGIVFGLFIIKVKFDILFAQ